MKNSPYRHLFTIHTQLRENISSKFSRNSEADASEFLENLEEMFLRYYMNGDI